MDFGQNSENPKVPLETVTSVAALAKPPILWLAQGLLILFAVLGGILAARIGSMSLGTAIRPMAITLMSIGLIAGIQKRARWARWGLVIGFGLFSLSSIWDLVVGGMVMDGKGPLEFPVERTGAIAGTVLVSIAFGALALRLAFGAAVKAFFDGHSPSTPRHE